MNKLLLIVTLCTLLAAGCANNPTEESFHSHTGTSNLRQSDNVLNCVMTNGYHVYEEDTECPIGGEKFQSLRLGTHSTYGRYLDWEPVSYMRFPVPIPVCPNNGFVMAEPEYTVNQLSDLEKVIQSSEYQDLYKEKHATYFLYAKLLELSSIKSSSQWWLYLNATWEADNCGDKARYKEYAMKVIAEAEFKLDDLSPNTEEYWVINIIIPNMHRRLGDFEQAEQYLSKIGAPDLTNLEANKFFLLAKKVLASAIATKSKGRVEIKEDNNE